MTKKKKSKKENSFSPVEITNVVNGLRSWIKPGQEYSRDELFIKSQALLKLRVSEKMFYAELFPQIRKQIKLETMNYNNQIYFCLRQNSLGTAATPAIQVNKPEEQPTKTVIAKIPEKELNLKSVKKLRRVAAIYMREGISELSRESLKEWCDKAQVKPEERKEIFKELIETSSEFVPETFMKRRQGTKTFYFFPEKSKIETLFALTGEYILQEEDKVEDLSDFLNKKIDTLPRLPYQLRKKKEAKDYTSDELRLTLDFLEILRNRKVNFIKDIYREIKKLCPNEEISREIFSERINHVLDSTKTGIRLKAIGALGVHLTGTEKMTREELIFLLTPTEKKTPVVKKEEFKQEKPKELEPMKKEKYSKQNIFFITKGQDYSEIPEVSLSHCIDPELKHFVWKTSSPKVLQELKVLEKWGFVVILK